MELSLYGREGDTLAKGMEQFKYLGRPLYKTDYYWKAYGGTSIGCGRSKGDCAINEKGRGKYQIFRDVL